MRQGIRFLAAFFQMMEILKKIFKFISSMRFAIILLVIVAVACMIGSLVPQGEQFEVYRNAYSERTAAFILAFHLDDVFHSWWFIVLTALLCLCLLLCNISRVRALIAETKRAADPAHVLSLPPHVTAERIADPEPVLKRLHHPHAQTAEIDGKPVRFSSRNRMGLWGAWICHIGIVLIVLGYALGQMTLFSTYVYGTPGQTKPIEGTDCSVTIDAFSIERSETGFVEQYVSTLTVTDAKTGKTQSGTASVNHPAVLCGRKFYQTATGTAAHVTIAENGTAIDSADLCVGEELTISFLPGLSLYLNAYEPDHNGSPAYQLLFFYLDQHMDVGSSYFAPNSVIELGSYTITLSEPIDYTQLRVKKDSFAWLVGIGAVLTTLGLFFALYLVPESVWAVQQEDGTWTVCFRSRKLTPLYAEQFRRAVDGRKEANG